MAQLPVAQLGYMPNMNLPTSRGRYEVRNPWEDMAMAVLGDLVSAGAKNMLARDFTETAAEEGLLGPQASTTIGPMQSMETGETFGAPSTSAPVSDQQNAGFFERLVQGPKTDASQLQQLRQHGAQRGMQRTDIQATDERQKRDILATADRARFEADQRNQVAAAERGFRAGEGDKDRALTTRGLDIQQQGQDDRYRLGAAGLALEAGEPQRDPAAAQAQTVFKEVMAQAQQARAFQNAQRMQSGQPLLPEMTPEEAAILYTKILKKIQEQYGVGQNAVTMPGVPLIGR